MRTLVARRAAAIREIASMGFRRAEIAAFLGMSPNYVSVIVGRFDIEIQPRETAFREFIRQSYALNVPPKEIARQLGTTAESVMVCASKMGAHQSRVLTDPWLHRRGFIIPEELRDEYKLIKRKLGCKAVECAQFMGLLQ